MTRRHKQKCIQIGFSQNIDQKHKIKSILKCVYCQCLLNGFVNLIQGHNVENREHIDTLKTRFFN